MPHPASGIIGIIFIHLIFIPLSLIITIFCSNLSISISSFVIVYGSTNNTCDNSSIITLHNWVITNASVQIAICFIALFFPIVFYWKTFHGEDLEDVGYPTMKRVFWITILYTIFTIIWNIIGSIIIFRDSPECRTQQIGTMTIVLLVFQWITLIFNIGFIPYVYWAISELRTNSNANAPLLI